MRIGILSLGLMVSAIPHQQDKVMLYTLWILAIGTNFTAAHRLIYVWFKTRKAKSQAQK